MFKGFKKFVRSLFSPNVPPSPPRPRSDLLQEDARAVFNKCKRECSQLVTAIMVWAQQAEQIAGLKEQLLEPLILPVQTRAQLKRELFTKINALNDLDIQINATKEGLKKQMNGIKANSFEETFFTAMSLRKGHVPAISEWMTSFNCQEPRYQDIKKLPDIPAMPTPDDELPLVIAREPRRQSCFSILSNLFCGTANRKSVNLDRNDIGKVVDPHLLRKKER